MSAALAAPWPRGCDPGRIDPRLALRLFDDWVRRVLDGPTQPLPPIEVLVRARDVLERRARPASFAPIPAAVLRGVLRADLDLDDELGSLRHRWESEWKT